MELKKYLEELNVEEMFEELNKINDFFERKKNEMLNNFIETLKQTKIEIEDKDVNIEIVNEGILGSYKFNNVKVETFTTFTVSENGLTVSFDTITVKCNEEVIISEMDMKEFEEITMFVENDPIVFHENLNHQFPLKDSKNVAKRMIQVILSVTISSVFEIEDILLKLKLTLDGFELQNAVNTFGNFKVFKDGEEIVNILTVSKEKIVIHTETEQIEIEPKDFDEFLKNKI